MANRTLTPWSGSRQWSGDPLYQLQREIDRVFDDVFSGGGRSGGGSSMTAMTSPRIDLNDENGELCLRADLPGIQPQDIDVRVEGDTLTISGERKSEQSRNERDYHVMERSHGRFQRTVQLPFSPNPDEVHAEMRHGVLEVHIPKHAAQERSRRIQVQSHDGQPSGGGTAMTHAIGGGSGSSGTGGSSGIGSSGASGSGASGSTGSGSRASDAEDSARSRDQAAQSSAPAGQSAPSSSTTSGR